MNPQETKDSFEEVRREIFLKKQARQSANIDRPYVEKHETTNDLSTEDLIGEEEPSQFQSYLDKQALEIKKKKEEAKRLKSYLHELKAGQHKKCTESIQKPSIEKSKVLAKRVKAILGNKSDIKMTLVAAEILSQPLATKK